MPLLDSLLSAIVRADGDALVMHVGERPYVVVGTQTINISTHGLNLDAMTGMLTELLPADSHVQLEEFGAVEYRIPEQGEDRFTVVAARGGDDIWIEIRRRRPQPAVVAATVAAPTPDSTPVTETIAKIEAPVDHVEPVIHVDPPTAHVELEPAVIVNAQLEPVVIAAPQQAQPEEILEPVTEPVVMQDAEAERQPAPALEAIAAQAAEASMQAPNPANVAATSDAVVAIAEAPPGSLLAEFEAFAEPAPEPAVAANDVPAFLIPFDQGSGIRDQGSGIGDQGTGGREPASEVPIAASISESAPDPIPSAVPIPEPEPTPIATSIPEPAPAPLPIAASIPEPEPETAPLQIAASIPEPEP